MQVNSQRMDTTNLHHSLLMPFIGTSGRCRIGKMSLTNQILSLCIQEWMEQHDPSPTGTTSLLSNAKH